MLGYRVVESISVTLPINQEQKTTNYVVYLEYATYTPLTQLHDCYCKNTFELVNFSVLRNELLDKLVCLKLVRSVKNSFLNPIVKHVLFTVFLNNTQFVCFPGKDPMVPLVYNISLGLGFEFDPQSIRYLAFVCP